MNILIIMSDEHSHEAMGCTGHPIVQTPVLDKLASEGTIFRQCYTSSPVCTPGRASFFTGLYVNQLGTWDNATPYDGKVKGISHQLAEHGYTLHSFGKLDFHPEGHYPGLVAPRPGQRDKIDVGAYFRDSNKPRPKVEERFKEIKVRTGAIGDDSVRDDAVQWLKQRSTEDEPWVLYVGFLHPHFPFHVQQKYWDYYNERVKEIPTAAKAPFDGLNEPLKALRTHFNADAADEETVRRSHVGYYSLISELDDNIGMILQTLEERGLADDTLIIYTSDHGEQLGNHGLWFKCCMYEESSHIPLIMKGPNVQKGTQNDTLVSLVDIYPTICQALNLPEPEGIQGKSLWNLALGQKDVARNDFVFSEYHSHGMPVGMYMIRWDKWKYVYYVGFEPQLFDLQADPKEMEDLAGKGTSSAEIRHVLAECERRLRSVCDPEEVDARAKAFQAKIKRELGLKDYTQGDPASQGYVNAGYSVPHPEYKL